MYYRHATTDDPLLDQMWHLEQVNTATAWDTTTGAPEVVVAVIDAGTLAQHPDFLGQTTEGYDFVGATDNYDGDGIDPDPEDATPLFDECTQAAAFYHGAHIAGTIGATGNNAEGIAGLSYTSTLMHLRALDGDCGGSTYDIYQALLYAIGAENDSGTVPNNPADVVNMSLGGGGAASVFQDAVNQAAAQGVIVVVSSGNEGASTVSYPAAYDNAFAIGATGLGGTVASYSNQGPKLDLVAPGGGGGGGRAGCGECRGGREVGEHTAVRKCRVEERVHRRLLRQLAIVQRLAARLEDAHHELAQVGRVEATAAVEHNQPSVQSYFA